ncbi:MAG: hypothetical protein Q9169_005343 [Polycauliona sp. 2 TL-2023]
MDLTSVSPPMSPIWYKQSPEWTESRNVSALMNSAGGPMINLFESFENLKEIVTIVQKRLMKLFFELFPAAHNQSGMG